jgi:adenine-specific DNA-methyltransferase
VARVSVLYINDDVFGPHLQLLRHVCEPESTSRPHVTVRYFNRLRIPDQHLTTAIEYIDLVEPGEFRPGNKAKDVNRTVYIACRSDDLVALEHKPHHPHSEFHITIYDGRSNRLAKGLLGVLQQFEWNFRVPLPPNTRLTAIEIRSRRSRKIEGSRQYSELLQGIFQEATSTQLSSSYLSDLKIDERLELSRLICEHLRNVVRKDGALYVHRPRLPTYRPRSVRSDRTGLFVTPPELALDITKYAVQLLSETKTPIHFGEPTVGTGAFYSALLQSVSPESITSAIGVDVSPRQANAAQARWSSRGMQVICGDYLHMNELPKRTLILANPPYLRHQRIPPKDKQDLRQRTSLDLGVQVSATSGQYVYFLLLSHKWMAPDAVAAWLIPSEFMQTSYGSAVRNYLTHNVQLLRVHKFGHDTPQFETAKTLPAVVVFRNRYPGPHDRVTFSAGGPVSDAAFSESVAISDLRDNARWSIPRRVRRPSSGSLARLGDLFVIRRGIATGANDYFIIERQHAAQLGLPSLALRPVLPKARTLTADVIQRERDGYPRLRPQLCLLDCDLPEDVIRERYPKLMAYLRRAKRLRLLERHLLKDRRVWYKQEPRESAPFLCTYMGRGSADSTPIRFIWNKSEAVATNTYLMMYPRPALTRILRAQPKRVEELFKLLQQTALHGIAEVSRVHAGGLQKIEPGELVQVELATTPTWLAPAVESELDLVTNANPPRSTVEFL